MKNRLQYFLGALAFVAILYSCKKDENRISLESAKSPVLTVSKTGPLTLTMAARNDEAVKFSWTNPDYYFTTGISSQDVNYTIEIDTTGANFTNPKKQEVAISKDLSKSFTVKELNTALAKLEVMEDMPHNIEFRLKASLSGAAPLYSNVIKMVVTPYLDVVVPVPTAGTLWITGDATTAGWSNPLGAPYATSQKFTKVSTTLYELTLAMPGGGAYKLIQEQGNWGTQYHMLAGGTWSSGTFEKADADPAFPGPPSAGNYKISVNFKTGQYTVTKL